MEVMEKEQVTERVNELQDERSKIQRKAFTKWINSHLSKAGLRVDDIFTDLQDGNKLLKLLEILSGDTVATKPIRGGMRQRFFKIENVNKALEFVRTKVRLESIGPEDIVDGNQVLILGLIWTIILRFQIQNIDGQEDPNNNLATDEEGDILTVSEAKESLLQWCHSNTEGYPHVKIQNFSNSWRNGMAFNAIIHAYKPGLFDFNELQPENHVYNLNHAFDAADILGVPKLLDAEDVDNDKPDDLSILTYLITLHDTLTKKTTIEIKDDVSRNLQDDKSASTLHQEFDENANSVKVYTEGPSKQEINRKDDISFQFDTHVNSKAKSEVDNIVTTSTIQDVPKCINNSANEQNNESIIENYEEEFEIIYNGNMESAARSHTPIPFIRKAISEEELDDYLNTLMNSSDDDLTTIMEDDNTFNVEEHLQTNAPLTVSKQMGPESIVNLSETSSGDFPIVAVETSETMKLVETSVPSEEVKREFSINSNNHLVNEEDHEIAASSSENRSIKQQVEKECQPINSDSVKNSAARNPDLEDAPQGDVVITANKLKESLDPHTIVNSKVTCTSETNLVKQESNAINELSNSVRELNNNDMTERTTAIENSSLPIMTPNKLREKGTNHGKSGHMYDHGQTALWIAAGILLVYAGHRLMKKGTT